MANPSPNQALQDAFVSAKENFLKKLTPAAKKKFDISTLNTLDDVNDAIRAIEQKQAKSKGLRGLKKIRPLLDGLQAYKEVVDTFAQVQPEILCLIWVWNRPILISDMVNGYLTYMS